MWSNHNSASLSFESPCDWFSNKTKSEGGPLCLSIAEFWFHFFVKYLGTDASPMAVLCTETLATFCDLSILECKIMHLNLLCITNPVSVSGFTPPETLSFCSNCTLQIGWQLSDWILFSFPHLFRGVQINEWQFVFFWTISTLSSRNRLWIELFFVTWNTLLFSYHFLIFQKWF